MKDKMHVVAVSMLLIAGVLMTGVKAIAQYEFKDEARINCTSVKNQGQTGTCWSFSTASFLESEFLRMGKGSYDLSEMYIVRMIYMDKARNYMLRQGHASFSQGALAHDLIKAADEHGLMTEEAYSGLLEDDTIHYHSELESGMKGFLDGVREQRRLIDRWPVAMEGILDAYLGEVPEKIEVEGKSYTPEKFAASLGFNADDYVSYTSFTHHPYGESFILEIPDNYSNGAFMNVPLDDFVSMVNKALDKGYTLAWDGDVSEKTFNAKKGLAILPVDRKREDLWDNPGEEIEVTAELRQEAFESLGTTDDHLMHLIGRAKDQNGTVYYIIKNSWRERGVYDGIIYMSESYFRMKTVSVLMHKGALGK